MQSGKRRRGLRTGKAEVKLSLSATTDDRKAEGIHETEGTHLGEGGKLRRRKQRFSRMNTKARREERAATGRASPAAPLRKGAETSKARCGNTRLTKHTQSLSQHREPRNNPRRHPAFLRGGFNGVHAHAHNPLSLTPEHLRARASTCLATALDGPKLERKITETAHSN